MRTKNLIAADSETFLITQGNINPRDVCYTSFDGEDNNLWTPKKFIEFYKEHLRGGGHSVWHNASFDHGCIVQNHPHMLADVWRAYEEGRIHDTMIIERLRFIANGWSKLDPHSGKPPRFGLDACVMRWLGEEVENKQGEDSYRLRFGTLVDVPFAQWPEAAKEYALLDAKYVWRVFSKMQNAEVISPDATRQTQSDWSLHIVSSWGVRADPKAVQEMDDRLSEKVNSAIDVFLSEGVYKLDRKGKPTKDMAAIRRKVESAYNNEPPTTMKGAIKTDVVTLRESGNDTLQRLADISNDQKMLSTYVPLLQKATKVPMNPRYFLVSSGRTSARGPNIQNLPRGNGVRECLVPIKGHAFIACDYSFLELCSLSQVLLDKLGQSNMADAINAGRDLHLQTASEILEISYDEAVKRHADGDKAVKEARQLSKAMNFGLGGGLGAERFSEFARTTYGLDVTPHRAKELKEKWLQAYPEMARYFSDIGDSLNADRKMAVTQLRSERVRGDVGFCDGCNTYFQGLAADGARRALFLVVRQCFEPSDVLFGSRVVAFIHDEILLSCEVGRVHEVGLRLSQLMVEGMREFLPDVKVSTEHHAMRRWEKNAVPRYAENGRLVCF